MERPRTVGSAPPGLPDKNGAYVSSTNGKAMERPAGAPDPVGHRPVRGPGDYVDTLETTAPMDVVDKAALEDQAGRAEVRRVAARVARANELVELGSSEALYN